MSSQSNSLVTTDASEKLFRTRIFDSTLVGRPMGSYRNNRPAIHPRFRKKGHYDL